jgi:aspartate racemase
VHIGLIGGIGPAATEFYYRGLIERHAASETPLHLTIAHADVREMARNLASRDSKKQAEVFVKLLRRLRAAGAKIAAVTSMGGHFCIGELEAISPIPLLNALPAVDAAIAERVYKTVGIIGTRMVMETRLYGAISSAMAMVGRVSDSQRRVFFRAGRRLIDRGGTCGLSTMSARSTPRLPPVDANHGRLHRCAISTLQHLTNGSGRRSASAHYAHLRRGRRAAAMTARRPLGVELTKPLGLALVVNARGFVPARFDSWLCLAGPLMPF